MLDINIQQSMVSVVIPCYNSETTIEYTLDSVLGQSYESIQVIVINDGSNDRSLDVVRSVQTRYGSKVAVFTQENKGQANARNYGIEISNSKYIAFIDSDDLWHPEKLEKQVVFMEDNPDLGMCYTSGIRIDEHGNEIGVINVNPLYRGRCFQYLIVSNNIVASSVLVKRSVFNSVGMFDTGLGACENWDLWLRIAQNFLIDFLDLPLTYYRTHQNNMSRDSDRMYQNRKIVLERYLSAANNDTRLYRLRQRAFHKHHKLYGQRLIEELKLLRARQELINALQYNYFDGQLYKMILKTFLGKRIFSLARKIKRHGLMTL